MRRIACGWFVAGLLSLASAARAAETEPSELGWFRVSPFSGILENSLQAFTGWNLALQLGGVASAPLLIASGADTGVHNFMVEHERLGMASAPAVYGGYLVPFVLGGSLLTWGLAKHSPRALAASSAVLQASLVVLVYQSLLKAVTGRPPPEAMRYDGDSASRTFRWGFLRGGVHYGWPSGHMMISASILASLLRVYPNSLWLKLGGSALLGYFLYAVASHEANTMHWCSDIVSGTLMGLAVGNAVGAGFAKRVGVGGQDGLGFGMAPMLAGQARGVTFSFRF
jgi:membrane-associated phospholipid phosphatase